jgi:hypothetical protein
MMTSTMGALSSRAMMMAITIPPQRPRRRLCCIRIGRPPPLLPPTALLILRTATATTTVTMTPPVEADKGGQSCHAALHCPLRGQRHVPILTRCRAPAFLFQKVGRIRATSIARLHLEGGNGRKQCITLAGNSERKLPN